MEQPSAEEPVLRIPSSIKATGPYCVSIEQAKLLAFLVKPGHKPCSGTGIIGWVDSGKTALVCICVRKRAFKMEPFLKKAQAQVAEQVKHQKRWYRRLGIWVVEGALRFTARIKLFIMSRG
jgi:hypothetical protein